MFEFILEFILTIIIEVIFWGIIALPGSLLIWILKGRKESLKMIMNKRQFSAVMIGFVFWFLILFAFTT